MRNRYQSTLVLCSCFLSFALVACGHEHVWRDATCTEPATCEECGETNGEPLGHTWAEATCTEPATCTVCGETEGEPLGHDWLPATHETPETCSRCGETRGEVLLYDVPAGFTRDHQFGEFDTFNSPASENGLGDTMIWLNASYDNVTSMDLPDVKASLEVYTALATDENGNTWFIELDLNEYTQREKYESLEGHKLCILAQYQGYSMVYEAPAAIVEKVFDRSTGDVIIPTWFSEL